VLVASTLESRPIRGSIPGTAAFDNNPLHTESRSQSASRRSLINRGPVNANVPQIDTHFTGHIVNQLFAKGDLASFVRVPRKRVEKEIRDQCSEHVILQVHDAIYAPGKRSISPVSDVVEEAIGIDNTSSQKHQHRRALTRLRALLESDVKERTLQDALFDSGLLANDCKIVQEVAMSKTNSYSGMRMDLVLYSQADQATEIVELKRGSHLLVARPGKPTQKLSRQLMNAIEQVKRYGDRVENDTQMTSDLEKRFGIQFDNLALRLVVGRRFPDAHGYHLLSLADTDARPESLQLQIYTWDGLLAELERIVN
jgi:hypothetical protein